MELTLEEQAAKIAKKLLRQSHEKQFQGKDWQGVAIDLTEEIENDSLREMVFNLISCSPDPDCECGFCKTAEWVD